MIQKINPAMLLLYVEVEDAFVGVSPEKIESLLKCVAKQLADLTDNNKPKYITPWKKPEVVVWVSSVKVTQTDLQEIKYDVGSGQNKTTPYGARKLIELFVGGAFTDGVPQVAQNASPLIRTYVASELVLVEATNKSNDRWIENVKRTSPFNEEGVALVSQKAS